MTTRKKKAEVPGPFGTTIVKGNHLTVITHPDGRKELQWDDEALLKEVRDAILSVEINAIKPVVRAKSSTRKKKDSNV